MKKHTKTAMALGVALIAGQAAMAATVGNAIGYCKLTVPESGQFAMYSVPLQNQGGGTMKLSDIFGDNTLTEGLIPDFADQVFIWDGENQEYVTLYKSSADHKFYNANTSAEQDPTMQPGQGFWLTGSAASAHDVYVSGQLVSTDPYVKQLGQGFHQVGTPYLAGWDIDGMDWSQVANASAGIIPDFADQLFVWDGSAYQSYFLNASYQWESQTGGANLTDALTSAGAVWYKAKSSSDVALAFDEP